MQRTIAFTRRSNLYHTELAMLSMNFGFWLPKTSVYKFFKLQTKHTQNVLLTYFKFNKILMRPQPNESCGSSQICQTKYLSVRYSFLLRETFTWHIHTYVKMQCCDCGCDCRYLVFFLIRCQFIEPIFWTYNFNSQLNDSILNQNHKGNRSHSDTSSGLDYTKEKRTADTILRILWN